MLEGLRSAAGGADIDALDKSIGALQKRQFMLVSAKDPTPKVFATRWAMSYLRGPLTKEEVQQLTAAAPQPAAARACGRRRSSACREPAPAPLAADETAVAPAVASGTTVSYLDPAAPWGSQVGATAGVTKLRAFVATRVALRYDDTAAGVDESQEFEALYGPLDGGLDLDAETVVDFDDRDFRPDAPAGATYVLPAAPIGEAKFFTAAAKDVQGRLVANRSLELFRNRELKLTSRPGEAQDAFLQRCDEAGQEKADAEAAKLKDRLETKKDRLENALELAKRRVDEIGTQEKSRAGEHDDRGRRRRPRGAVRRQAERALDRERGRLGRLQGGADGDDIAAQADGRGKGRADDRRPRRSSSRRSSTR